MVEASPATCTASSTVDDLKSVIFSGHGEIGRSRVVGISPESAKIEVPLLDNIGISKPSGGTHATPGVSTGRSTGASLCVVRWNRAFIRIRAVRASSVLWRPACLVVGVHSGEGVWDLSCLRLGFMADKASEREILWPLGRHNETVPAMQK
jgi:hypothetical protein